jgi:hypothetical protein
MYTLVCKACGRPERRPGRTRSTLCGECQRRRGVDRQRQRRCLRAGLVTATGEPVGRKCEHCGEPFVPERTTARFCSPKCRVYFHRP